jgi:hypothetical protein
MWGREAPESDFTTRLFVLAAVGRGVTLSKLACLVNFSAIVKGSRVRLEWMNRFSSNTALALLP